MSLLEGEGSELGMWPSVEENWLEALHLLQSSRSPSPSAPSLHILPGEALGVREESKAWTAQLSREEAGQEQKDECRASDHLGVV